MYPRLIQYIIITSMQGTVCSLRILGGRWVILLQDCVPLGIIHIESFGCTMTETE